MANKKFLTKSLFSMAQECDTKLNYVKKPEYANKKTDDPFLEALADGGYQVGALAKAYFENGHDITTHKHEEALEQTNTLLQQSSVTIFEPAVQFENLFIRIDILVKRDNHFDLYEVKAKSYDRQSKDDFPFTGKQGKIKSKWASYLNDVAFQHYVLSKAFPDCTINSHLLLVDKQAICQTDGLNQKFRISRADNIKGITVSQSLSEEDLSHRLLIPVPVNDEVTLIYESEQDGLSFSKKVSQLADAYVNDVRIKPEIGTRCKTCEFNSSPEEERQGIKSGFKNCWREELQWNDEMFEIPTVMQLWDNRSVNIMFRKKKYTLLDLKEDDFNLDDDGKPGLTRQQRQWLQVEKVKNNDNTRYFDSEGFRTEMAGWKYPLHFIDFETIAPALPFNKGLRPYEAIAFQFSHHIMHEDGRIEHAGEYINDERGFFPNFDFARALKKQIGNDSGTVFRFHNHENTILNTIYQQLKTHKNEIEDAEELCQFIMSITHSTNKLDEKWVGERDMVDLQVMVTRYYYHPSMGGSNSIKDVLPAILNDSEFLQKKYSHPLSAIAPGFSSYNFPDEWVWIDMENRQVKNPYKKLPKVLDDIAEEEETLANGGAAMTAYARLQFEDVSDVKREAYRKALLKYCELDTLAMVMIFEAWKDMVENSEKKSLSNNSQCG